MNFVSLDPTQNPYATDAAGLPTSDDSAPAAPNVDMPDPDGTSTPSGFLSSIESFGSAAVASVESGVSTVYNAGKTVVGDAVAGTENAASKVASIGTGAVTSITGNLVLILAVVGVALVLIAQSGAIKVSR